MFRVTVYQNIEKTLLFSQIRELISANGNSHACRIHGWRSASVGDSYAAEAFYYDADFVLEGPLASPW